MAKKPNQKARLFRLYEILRIETDENHPIKAKELLQFLRDEGFECERKTLYDDIDALKKCGIDVHSEGYKYYIAGRDLSLAQIRFLVDATASAAFLTKNQTTEICAAISMLAGSHRAELLSEKVITFDKKKHTNNEVLQTLENIFKAIENEKRITFKYFSLGINAEREYHKNGDTYTENPIGLVFNDGYYYLVCYSEKYDDFVQYRVDRICNLELSDMNNCCSIYADRFDKIKDSVTAFGMWNGKFEVVTLLLEKAYLPDIYDKFGCDIKVSRYDNEHYCITERVVLSDTFYGWVAGYGTHIKIAAPKYVKEAFVEKMQSTISQY